MKAELNQYQVEPEPFWLGLLVRGGDGYDAIELAQKRGWHALPCWGKQGWDLGSWPLVVVFTRKRQGMFDVIEYVEGDVTQYACPTEGIREAIINELAFFHWKHQGKSWVEGYDVEGYDSVEQLPDELRGPYTFFIHT